MRTALQKRTDQPPILSYSGRCLKFYPSEVWETKVAHLASRPFPRPDVQDYQRLVLANSAECPIDGQGRILVPPYLRGKAGLEREVTIVGQGIYLEIWDRERFAAEQKRLEARFEHLETEVSKDD